MAQSTENDTTNSPKTGDQATAKGAPIAAGPDGRERRVGPRDRRVAAVDRRNEDRLADELLPRRNPDVPDRRLAAHRKSVAQAAGG